MLSPLVLRRCTREVDGAFVVLFVAALALFLSEPWGSHHSYWWGQLYGGTENFLRNTILINALAQQFCKFSIFL